MEVAQQVLTTHENGGCLEEYIPESSPYDHMEPMEMEEANILDRVTSLPLVANTWDAVSTYYVAAKKTYPSVTPYLEAAEKITTGAANVALATTKPVIDKFAPTVNSYANRGLDKLQDALPMIHDQPDEIYGATKAAVASLFNRKIDSALSVTEKYVDYYLPPKKIEDASSDTESNSDDESDNSSVMNGSEGSEPASPKERIVVMTHKVRERAYYRAMDKINSVQKRSNETLNKLSFTVDLIQYAKENMDSTRDSILSKVATANESIRNGVVTSQENVANVWKEIRTRSSDATAELRVLERARALTGQVQKACGTVLSIISDIPQYEFLRTKVLEAKDSADALAQSLVGKTSISELSASVTTMARSQIEHFGKVIEALFDVVANKSPMNWLVLEIPTPEYIIHMMVIAKFTSNEADLGLRVSVRPADSKIRFETLEGVQALDFDSDPFEGLFMHDLEVELHMNNNPANNVALIENQAGNHIRYRRG